MRGLLNHYCGLQLPEAAVFGLGSGLACVYLSGENIDPARMLFGRTIHLEVDLADNLQADYREQTEEDDDLAWEHVREEVMAGRPTMLSGDIFYLDYREYKVHFPGHRFVLLGFDDDRQKIWIADRINVEPELCSYEALRKSRNPPEGMSTHNLWGRFHGSEVGRPLVDAARVAIERCVQGMLTGVAPDVSGVDTAAVATGIPAIRRLARDIPGWAERDDATWIASYNARCIEKFGNGGGNFRRLYAGFLSWARALDTALVPAGADARAMAAADGWTALSEILSEAARGGAPPSVWSRAGAQAEHIADLEEELFEFLAS